MYKLENNVEWTENLKNAFKHGITRGKIKYTNDNNQEVVIDYDNGLKSFKLYDEKNVPSQGFIGQATARQVDLELINTININNLENKEFELFLGADYNNQTYYINYGKFIVNQAPENDLTNGIIKITAFDYMIKANIPYVPVVTFPCTLKAVVDDICVQTELELATLDFANADFIVDSNQFDGKTCREVLCHVGKCAFSWARIGQDNKLYIDYEVKDLLDFKLAEIDGNTFQPTYTGKNVFNEDDLLNINGWTKNTLGFYQGNVDKLYNYYLHSSLVSNLEANTQYAIQLYGYAANNNNYLRIRLYYSDGTTQDSTPNTFNQTEKVISVISKANKSLSAIRFIYSNSGTIYIKEIQVEKNSEVTPYEPFTNNQPSPSPDFLQNIQIVTGNNNVLVNNGNLGNMTALYNAMYAFNPNQVAQELVDGKNCIRFRNASFMAKDGFRGLLNRYKKNTRYKLNFKLRVYDDTLTTSANLYIEIRDKNQKRIANGQYGVANHRTWQDKEIVTPANTDMSYISFSYGNATIWCIADLSIIEYNSQETYTYKESQEQNYPITLGSIELCKIGNYRDKIIKKYDGWYLHKEIDKIILNGTETWKVQNVANFQYSCTNFNIPKSVQMYSDKFVCYTSWQNIHTPYFRSSNVAGQLWAELGTENTILDEATVQKWQTWLSNNNTKVYYPLEASTETKITDTTLISQLNALYNAKLYEGKNYIIPQAEANNLTGTYIFNTSKSSLTIADVTSIDTTTYDMADKITIEDYYQDKFKTANEMYGAINRVVYADSNIQGQEEKVEDTDDIAINGVHELTIYDNYFAYTTEKRQQLIQAGTRLFGMKYMPIQQLEMVGLAYLDCNDILEVASPDNNKFAILPLNHIIEYNGAVKDSLTLETNSTTQTNYKNTNSPMNANSLAEIIVDRAMREIKMIVDQYVNFLHNKTGNNNIFIDGTRDGEGFITKFVIKGSTTYFTQNSITIVVSEGIKNEETTLLTEDSDTLLTESSDSLLGETKTLYIASKNIVLDAPLRNLIVNEVNHYDEIQILQDGTIQVIRRIGVSQNQTLYVLDEEEITILQDKFVIPSREEGLYYFVEELNNLDYYAEYIIKNEYSDIYATEAYVNAGLDLKIDTNRLVSELNASADIIKLIGQRLIIQMDNFSLDETGYMNAKAGQISGFTMLENRFYKAFDMLYDFSRQDMLLLAGYLNSYNALDSGIRNLYTLNPYQQQLTVLDLQEMIKIYNGLVENTKYISGSISIKSNNCNELIEIINNIDIPKTRFGVFSIYSYLLSADVLMLVDDIENSAIIKGIVLDRVKRQITVTNNSNETIILPTGITTPTLVQTSKAEDKKDFERLENALDEVMNTDIYTYHLKSQNEEDKKHVGFVIGNNFKYSHLITAENDKKEEIGVDPYSMVSVLWKAVQEQQIQIEELKKEIKKLKGE